MPVQHQENTNEVTNIVLIGVGGQGTILVSRIITYALTEAGYDVKMSEIHGMAQRGGSVSTQIRYGKKVYSPIIGQAEADILIAFEKMEALRGSSYLKPGNTIIVNDYEIMPLPVAVGKVDYPDKILEELASHYKTIVINAGEAAKKLGNSRVMNVVLLGAMVEACKLNNLDWQAALRENIPTRYLDVNQMAFEHGRQLVLSAY
ncbi:MAG TPA: indolepyruvate oxidoreductase subunit beta [Clostridiaceae bacterium]|nr:indolepyruvate oxidoreductase subunit beta [Clostridiaceae bacterium]